MCVWIWVEAAALEVDVQADVFLQGDDPVDLGAHGVGVGIVTDPACLVVGPGLTDWLGLGE
jgi:hypothetical protein